MPYLVYFLDGSSIAATATDLDEATGLAIDEAADRHYTCLEVDYIEPDFYEP